MSLDLFLGDVFTGNFTNAEARLKNWWNNSVSPLVKTFATAMATGEGKILEGLVGVAAKDVIAGGLTTASFVNALKDIGTQLVAQNITLANTTIMAALNTAVTTQAAASGVALPTNAGTTVVPAPVVATSATA